MSTPPSLTTEGTKRKKRRLSNKNALQTQEETVKVKKKKRSLQPVSKTTSPNTSRSPSPSQSSNDSVNSTQITPANTATATTTTKRSIRAASAAINKREQEKEPSVEPSLSSEPTSPTKRSIRAASDAISKRELEKKLSVNTSPSEEQREESQNVKEKKPVVKRRRKLNIQKAVVLPNAESPSDEIELEGAPLNSYSKYLNPNKTTSTVTPITLGVSKKRKMISRKNTTAPPPQPQPQKESRHSAYTTDTPTNTTAATEEEQLDLSQHVILPNSSYIAHLRNPATRSTSIDSSAENYYSDQSSNTSNKSSPTSEFYDAASDFDSQKDVFMSSLDEDDSTAAEYMDFEYNKSPSQDMVVDPPLPAAAAATEPYVAAEPKKGFWKSVLTFARFANDR